MPEICRFFGIIIRMFPGDHPPPHFHAEYAGRQFTVDIRTAELLDGEPGKRQLELARKWLALHRAELLENWDRIERQQAPGEIEPLR